MQTRQICRLSLMLACLSPSPARAQVAWVPSFDQAKSAAKALERFIVLDVSADWCPPCRKMAKEVYPDPQFIEFSGTQVFMLIDAYKSLEGPRLSSRYDAKVFPTILVLDSEGREIDRLTGGRTTEGLIEDLTMIFEDPRTSKELNKAAESAGEDFDLLNLAGVRALNRDDDRRACTFLDHAWRLASARNQETREELLIHLNQACFNDGKFDYALQAQADLEALNQAYGALPWMRIRKARTLLSLDRHDESAELLNEILQGGGRKDRDEARKLMGRLPKKYRKAEEEATKRLKKARKDLDKGKLVDAFGHIQRAFDLTVPSSDLYVTRATIRLRMAGKAKGAERDQLFEQGFRDLRLARQVDPDDMICYARAKELLASAIMPAAPKGKDARKKWKSAEKHFAGERYRNAAEDYLKILEIEPEFGKAYLHLGDCFYANGQYDQALKLYLEAAKRTPLDPAPYRFVADTLVKLNRSGEAPYYLTQSLLADPQYPIVWTNLEAVSRSRRQGFERHTQIIPPHLLVLDPEEEYESLFNDLPPQTVAAWREYANHKLYWRREKFQETHPEAPAYFTSAQEEIECLNRLVERWSSQKEQDDGLADDDLDFIRQVTLDGQLDCFVYLELFTEEFRNEFEAWKQGHKGRVASYLDRFIYSEPQFRARNHPRGLTTSAVEAYNEGVENHQTDPNEAIGHYERALLHAPKYTSALMNLSLVLEKTGRLEDAESMVRRWAETRPTEYRPFDNLSLILSRKGDREGALVAVAKALELVTDPEQKARLLRNQEVFQRQRDEP